MGAWLSNISLKYKFWAVSAVAFFTTLMLVLYAVQPLPKADNLLTLSHGQAPLLNGQPVLKLTDSSGWVDSATTSKELAALAGELSKAIGQLKR